MKFLLAVLTVLLTVSVGFAVTILEGVITDDMTLTADEEYLLRGGVFVGDTANTGVTLTIEPGTFIYGEQATDGMLVIAQGSKIMAEGTADNPIVFTSDQLEGEQNRADWGGVIINGYAPLNTGDIAYGEGDTGPYGGDDPNDNSGVMQYCRIEFAGREISPDNELNGLALQGVGDATTIEYIQVHMNKDDGIEFFGGTVNAKYILITGAADDQFDWTDGWQGKGQFWICQQYGDDADQGIEADNNGEENEATPRSMPTIYNLTLIGDRFGAESDIGMLLREGTGAVIKNAIVLGFGDAGVDLDHTATFENAYEGGELTGSLLVDNSIIFDNTDHWQKGETEGDDESNYDFTTRQFLTELNANNRFIDPQLMDPFNTENPNFRPIPKSPALMMAAEVPADDDFFTEVDFIGAVGPNPNDDWTAGWTRGMEMEPQDGDVVILEGTIISDSTLTSNNEYLLRGGVFIGDENNNATLTIEPGTRIYGEQTSDGMLVIAQGSKIMAHGSPYFPIVFTSDQLEGEQNRADWGGVIINGLAPLNTGDIAYGEGDTGPYGGDDPNDNSGLMMFCRIEYAGREISPDNELNGLALQGVGDGTVIDYIQVHMNKDDGVEFFGGTVNAKHLYVTGAADDQFDWTDGWRGMGQFWICQQYGDDADQGIEADNNGEDNDAAPRSKPTIYNMTLIGDKGEDESDIGMLLREGTGAIIRNSIIANFGDCGIDIDHPATFDFAADGEGLSGNLIVDNCIFYDNMTLTSEDSADIAEESSQSFTTEDFVTSLNSNNRFENPELWNPYSWDEPDFSPKMSSMAFRGFAETPDNEFFDNAEYVGAIGYYNWLIGWTTPGTSTLDVDGFDHPAVPTGFEITSIYPNPFNPSVYIQFNMPVSNEVILSVFDINGRLIERLNAGTLSAGSNIISWNGNNHSAGTYFFQLEAGDIRVISKATLIQ